jgi:DNA-binding protein HU-beta
MTKKALSKSEFAKLMATTNETSIVDAEKAIEQFTKGIMAAAKQGDNVALVGFGTFEVRERAAREGRNLHTGEKIQIAVSKTVALKVGKLLKESVNQGS